MASFDVFQIAGSAMNAQSVRLNTIASNISNADSVSSTPEATYKARHTIFAAMLKESLAGQGGGAGGVKVKEVMESNAAPIVRHDPNHPMADAQGNVYMPNVNVVEEMANMIAASRSYQNNIEVFNTTKQLMLRTINMGQ